MHRHVLAADGERAFVAEEDDRIVGFSAAIMRGDFWYFSGSSSIPPTKGGESG
jgi:hypothetical protein